MFKKVLARLRPALPPAPERTLVIRRRGDGSVILDVVGDPPSIGEAFEMLEKTRHLLLRQEREAVRQQGGG